MKNKVMSLFLALVLCLCLAPVAVYADVNALSSGQKFDFSYDSEGYAMSGDFWIAENGWYSFTPIPYAEDLTVLSYDAVEDAFSSILGFWDNGSFYAEFKADSVNYVLAVGSGIQSVTVEYHGDKAPEGHGDDWFIEDGVLIFYDTVNSCIEIPDDATEIGEYAMLVNDTFLYLTEVIIPNSVVKLDDYAFNGCFNLTSVTIPSSVVEIGKEVFVTTVDQGDELVEGVIPGLTIYCEEGSYAQTYCQENSIPFEIIGGSTQPSQPTTPPAETIPASGTAVASTQTVTVDGKKVEFQMYALVDENGNGTNYIKLRDMAQVLNGTEAQFSVGYDNASKSISVATGEAYTSTGSEMTTPFSGDRAYTGGSQSIQVDGEATEMTAITLLDDAGGGYNYFKLRDLGKALGFNVGWSKEAGVFIESDKPYAE